MSREISRAFPIPVVALGPGSQPEDEPIELLSMPQGMDTYRAPSVPEPEAFAGQGGALAALHAVHGQLLALLDGGEPQPVDLSGLTDAERRLVNEVLGEGEVAAQVIGDASVRVQESVFAGVWRVLRYDGDRLVGDALEVGAVPAAIPAAAGDDARAPRPAAPALPADAMNAPAIYAELEERTRGWQPGQPAHVINLTLLPLTPGDSEWLEARLARGRVQVLSRGYGNCRIVDTRLPKVWRVTYFNSQDIVILDTLEVCAIPDVACAAREDLEDSATRMAEVLEWVEAP